HMKPACTLRLKRGREADIRAGTPWIMGGDMVESSEHLIVPAGSIAIIESHNGEFVGLGTLNPKSPIACRVLTLQREPIDAGFFAGRIGEAMKKREPIGVPFSRLAHSEADALPGLLIDRFGGHVVVQVGTAGME